MTWIDFAIRLVLAFILGAGIGIERQWLKTRAVLKTNVLVTLGAAMFVMLAAKTPGDTSPTRVAAQVVSGIGFLGAGVILREGTSVRGINTAATLWCAASIGCLVGSGYILEAYFGTLTVVGANLLLRPLVEVFKKQIDVEIDRQEFRPTTNYSSTRPKNDEIEQKSLTSRLETYYRCSIICSLAEEANVLALLLQSVREKELILVAIHSQNVEDSEYSDREGEVEIKADFLSKDREDELKNLEQVVSLLKSKARVNAVSWQFIAKDS